MVGLELLVGNRGGAPRWSVGRRNKVAQLARFALAIVMLASHARTVDAQVEPDMPPIRPHLWKGGYNGLAMLCRLNGLLVHDRLSTWRATPPDQSIAIVLGRTTNLPFNPITYLREGGAMLVATDRGDRRLLQPWGVRLMQGPVVARDPASAFYGRMDCPLASVEEGEHAMLGNWGRLATNQSGYLTLLSGFARTANATPIAKLSDVRTSARTSDPWFAAALERRSPDGPLQPMAVVCADQSIFNNQMLGLEDNARFAQQSLRWLANEHRTDVLILAERGILNPMQPDRMVLPPPDPKDVMKAMQSLPPQALLEFANLVMTTAEDEGVIDELIVDVSNQVPRQSMLRFLIVSVTIFLALWLLYRLFNRRTDAQPSGGQRSGRRRSARAAIERRQAAIVLLDQLRSDLTSGSTQSWGEVLDQLPNSSGAKKFRKQVQGVLDQIYHQALNVWSSKQLIKLERQVSGWREDVRQGSLALTPPEAGLVLLAPASVRDDSATDNSEH